MSPRVSIRLLPAQSDGRLVELTGRGHEHAFEALVNRYRRPLLRYCRRMGLSDARAEDVLQRSLTKAWLALSQGKEVRELRPWLYRIVHNDAVNSVLRAPAEHEQLTDTLASASSLERDLEGRRAARETLAGVASLPRMQRHAIVLTAIEGHSHHEAARALGITDGAVRGLLHRARTTLRSAAAAVTPPGLLLRWRGIGGVGERAGELAAGGGAVGATGVLLKGAALTATVGLLALGAGVERSAHRTDGGVAPRHASRSSSVAGQARGTASALVAAPNAATVVNAMGRVRGHVEGERNRFRRGYLRRDPADAGGEGRAGVDGAPGAEESGAEEPRSEHGGGRDDGAVRGGSGGNGPGGGHDGPGGAERTAEGAEEEPSSGPLDDTDRGRSVRGSTTRGQASSGDNGSSGLVVSNAAEQQPTPSETAVSGAEADGSTRGGGEGDGRGDGSEGGADGQGDDGRGS